jgi:hypothetical protein
MGQAVLGKNAIKVWPAPVVQDVAFFCDREMVAGTCGDFKSSEGFLVNQGLELFVIHLGSFYLGTLRQGAAVEQLAVWSDKGVLFVGCDRRRQGLEQIRGRGFKTIKAA